jgi:serine/threonine-protein kinase
MGEVRLCKDGRIGRDVAMKVILPDHRADTQLRARFLREARVQGQLEHPSIVPVYDLGVDEQGGMYFTMKCLRGMTLAQILTRLREGDPEVTRQFSRRKLLTNFSSVCLTIDFAHSRGVLHRDLKPSNVMLGDFGEVYVLDWGIAKLRAEDQKRARPVVLDESSDDIQTAAGKALGTFGYMSPEQVLGKIGELDARTDVYALGTILFEILTLEPLHPRTTWTAMLSSTLKDGAARTSIRRPDLDVPPELEAICVKATMVTPENRYASARELHEAVERFLDGDRDLELRRHMVVDHARAATEAAARALDGGDNAEAARREALHNVGRTLALDPGNRTAMRALGQVISATPKKFPKEVTEELARSTALRYRLQLEDGIRLDLALALVIAPVAFWMGILDVGLLVFALASVLISILFKLAGIKRRTTVRWQFFAYGAYVFNIIGVSAIGRGFGPLFVIPTLIAICTFMHCGSHHRGYRATVLITGALTILAPVFCEVLGILPRSYVFQDGAMTILPNSIIFTEQPTIISLTVANLFAVLAPGLMMGKFQRLLREAERQSMLQAWHLRQLVPDEARAAVTKAKVA